MKFEYLKKKKKKGTEVMTSYRLLKKENMLIINKVSVNHDTYAIHDDQQSNISHAQVHMFNFDTYMHANNYE